jgi:hypothetical protein
MRQRHFTPILGASGDAHRAACFAAAARGRRAPGWHVLRRAQCMTHDPAPFGVAPQPAFRTAVSNAGDPCRCHWGCCSHRAPHRAPIVPSSSGGSVPGAGLSGRRAGRGARNLAGSSAGDFVLAPGPRPIPASAPIASGYFEKSADAVFGGEQLVNACRAHRVLQ